MLGKIHAYHLGFVAHPEPDGLVDGPADHQGHATGEGHCDHYRYGLSRQLLETAAVEEAAAHTVGGAGEEARGRGGGERRPKGGKGGGSGVKPA